MSKMIKTEKIILVVTVLALIGTATFFFSEGGGEQYNAGAHTVWSEPVDAQEHSPEHVQQLVNINTADADQLQTLYGIGPVLAQRIVSDREENGPFRLPENIIRVKGIGQGKLEQIINYITVG